MLLSLLALASCASDGDSAATPSVSPSASASIEVEPPARAEVKAAFLTEEEVGEGFSGARPTKASKNVGGKDPDPVCGVKPPEERFLYSTLFTHETGTTQVFEEIIVYDDAGTAEKHVVARRRQGEARCEYDETAGDTKYHVKVDGPVADFPALGESSAAYALTYTGGYEGRRYAMIARIGVTTVYMEYTAPELEEELVIDTFRKAVDKATEHLA